MCYDMSFFSNIKLIADYLNIATDLPLDFTPTYHKVAQAFPLWPVVVNENGMAIKLFEWGLIADYMNTPERIKQYRNSMANARSEKILGDKRSVWHRIRQQRCLVFSTGFFEHHDAGLKKKVPFFITIKEQPVFCFAGLYNYAPVPDWETGELRGSFAIITRPANALMKKIHNAGNNSHRMPLILTKELALQWLQPQLSDEAIREILAFELPATQMESWAVNTIRTRKQDDETILTPVPFQL